MIATGKAARRQYGTRFAAKKSKGGKGKHFAVCEQKVGEYPNGEAAYALARRLGFLGAPYNTNWR